MNKKTVILLVILVLLVITILFRWDIRTFDNGYYVVFNDRLTFSYIRYSGRELKRIMISPLVVTLFLYGATIATVGALLREVRKDD